MRDEASLLSTVRSKTGDRFGGKLAKVDRTTTGPFGKAVKSGRMPGPGAYLNADYDPNLQRCVACALALEWGCMVAVAVVWVWLTFCGCVWPWCSAVPPSVVQHAKSWLGYVWLRGAVSVHV